jgi:glyoxylase-like metal-dependent hydrolase (beta-lactamase superfamily II)/8-oxo-dGTP pyrophosphatase MutT (NUDIX family)
MRPSGVISSVISSIPCNMTRPSQHLHPATPIAPAQPAATLIWYRDAQKPQGLEVLLTQRSHKARFAPSAHVFPGGRIDDGDSQYAASWAQVQGQPFEPRLTHSATALRESFEELGIFLGVDEIGHALTPSQLQKLARNLPLWPQLQALGWRAALDQLNVVCHWSTDRDLPIRFEVPFMAALAPKDQEPQADGHEQLNSLWISPKAALAQHHKGDLPMVYPTIKTLERLVGFSSAKELQDALQGNEPWFSSCPRGGFMGGREARYMEGEGPFGELALTCPEGQVKHVLDWQSDQPVALLKNLSRLTAPNPSLMTGPGTNTYLVGDPQTGFIVIDPGPALAGHIERLHQATGGNIQAIVCTHSHADHSPGAKPLQAMCTLTHPPIWGVPSGESASAASYFVPDRVLEHNQRLQLGSGAHTHTLRAVWTPGHAANHVCLIFEEEGILFSGDHILNGSTAVINPPDGNMTHFLESLDLLHACCEREKIEFIAPAHGHVMGNHFGAPHDPMSIISQLKAHRLKREAKIKAVVQRNPKGRMEDWLPLAYDDVPERLWPAAMRSLTAHVMRLIELGLGVEHLEQVRQMAQNPTATLQDLHP